MRTGVVFTACDPLLRHFSEKPAAVIWSASSPSGEVGTVVISPLASALLEYTEKEGCKF